MSWSVADAVDYKGFPADRSKTGGWVPAALILGLFSSLKSHHSDAFFFSFVFTFSGKTESLAGSSCIPSSSRSKRLT